MMSADGGRRARPEGQTHVEMLAAELGVGRPGQLGRGVAIRGDVLAREDLVVEGHLDGSLSAPGHAITIARGGVVRGHVFAHIILVEGSASGELTATERVEVAAGARVEADITAPSVALAEGAWIVGRIDMARADAAAHVARYRLQRLLAAEAG
jgi:cytoskeletal protein CcmA (bactofilin family)